MLIAACFASFWAEGLVPDVHDGDAPASVIAASDQGHVPGQAVAPASAAVEHSESVPVQGDGGPAQQHPVHVDHCAHGHALVTPETAAAAPSLPPRPDAPRSANVSLHSVQRPPRLRPPIA